MGGAAMKPAEFTDIQGFVRFGYRHMTEACFVLVKIKDAAAARAWISGVLPLVTSAEERSPRPTRALHVAFTPSGLKKLGVPAQIVNGFSLEFRDGIAGNANRSRRLGDTGTSAPEGWEWGLGGQTPHAVVLMFANPGGLNEWRAQIQNGPWPAAFEEFPELTSSGRVGKEPFGFGDGISQPTIDWEQKRHPSANLDQLAYSNDVCLGEFVLGYSNEYSQLTDRPVLSPGEPGSELLPDAPDGPGKDLGKNGTYMVLRDLEQDVRGFWQFLDKAAGAGRYELAEAMVGRRLQSGAPLMPLRSSPVPGAPGALNQFTYDADPLGARCPLGAHIRRANPRNPDIPGNPTNFLSHLFRKLGFGNPHFGDDLVASTRFHRLLRRGREYGPELSPEEALTPKPPDDPKRGLYFIAINANIERQFEFIQNAWLMRTKFDGLTEESDPLLGNRAAVEGCPYTNAFSRPQESSVRRRVLDVPQFVTVRGGAYFFLPGIRALRYLSRPLT